jgi:hypothetical protein
MKGNGLSWPQLIGERLRMANFKIYWVDKTIIIDYI